MCYNTLLRLLLKYNFMVVFHLQQMSFEFLIKDKLDKLSPGQRKVAEYILQNPERFSYDTLAKIGRDTNVSETTVIRLSYALGFNSFSEMQKHIQNEILGENKQNPENEEIDKNESNIYFQTIQNDIKILNQTLNRLDVDYLQRIINTVINAKHVVVVGYRTAYSAAHWFATTLGYLRENVQIVPHLGDMFEPLLSITEDSVVVAISFPRYSRGTYQFAEMAKKLGGTIIAVTDNKLSPIGALSHMTLITNTNRGENGYNSMAPVISLLNLIIAGIRFNEHQKLKDRLQKLEELYTSQDVFFE